MLGRLMAVLSLAVVLFGKPVHLHQECGCCPVEMRERLTADEASLTSTACPFGCPHHATPVSDTERESQPRPCHDGQHCTVCQQLAQAPDLVAIVAVPIAVDVIVPLDEVRPSLCAAFLQHEQSRGPPHASHIRCA